MGHCHVRGNAGNRIEIQCLRDQDYTVADLLKSAGYRTALCGKWGLGDIRKEGETNSGLPNLQGFDFFYGYLNQRHAHNYYPEYLWRNGKQEKLNNVVTTFRQRPRAKTFPAGYATERNEYSHDLIMNEARQFIQSNKDRPFFLYLALTIPHANNEGTRGTGDGQEVPDYGIYEKEDWKNQDKGQAAMISRMDAGIGELIKLLKILNIDNNTLIMFTSDNGHHDEGGHDTERFNPNGPLRGMKRDLYEGGIRVPLIVRWPGKVPANQLTDHISYSGDLMNTVAELLELSPREALDSVSFLPTLLGNEQEQKNHNYLYWESYEKGTVQAVRQGKWKAVRYPMFSENLELFDLDNDLGESQNVASEHPHVVKKMLKFMDESHAPHSNWKVGGKVPAKQSPPGKGKMPEILSAPMK